MIVKILFVLIASVTIYGKVRTQTEIPPEVAFPIYIIATSVVVYFTVRG